MKRHREEHVSSLGAPAAQRLRGQGEINAAPLPLSHKHTHAHAHSIAGTNVHTNAHTNTHTSAHSHTQASRSFLPSWLPGRSSVAAVALSHTQTHTQTRTHSQAMPPPPTAHAHTVAEASIPSSGQWRPPLPSLSSAASATVRVPLSQAVPAPVPVSAAAASTASTAASVVPVALQKKQETAKRKADKEREKERESSLLLPNSRRISEYYGTKVFAAAPHTHVHTHTVNTSSSHTVLHHTTHTHFDEKENVCNGGSVSVAAREKTTNNYAELHENISENMHVNACENVRERVCENIYENCYENVNVWDGAHEDVYEFGNENEPEPVACVFVPELMAKSVQGQLPEKAEENTHEDAVEAEAALNASIDYESHVEMVYGALLRDTSSPSHTEHSTHVTHTTTCEARDKLNNTTLTHNTYGTENVHDNSHVVDNTHDALKAHSIVDASLPPHIAHNVETPLNTHTHNDIAPQIELSVYDNVCEDDVCDDAVFDSALWEDVVYDENDECEDAPHNNSTVCVSAVCGEQHTTHNIHAVHNAAETTSDSLCERDVCGSTKYTHTLEESSRNATVYVSHDRIVVPQNAPAQASESVHITAQPAEPTHHTTPTHIEDSTRKVQFTEPATHTDKEEILSINKQKDNMTENSAEKRKKERAEARKAARAEVLALKNAVPLTLSGPTHATRTSLTDNPSSSHIALPTHTTPGTELGTWFFDRRTQRRKYLSLSGVVYTGSEAMRRCQSERNGVEQSALLLRAELCALMREKAPATLLAIRRAEKERAKSVSPTQTRTETHTRAPDNAHANTSHASVKTESESEAPSALCELSTWGLPQQLVSRYASHRIERLFPWQADALLSAEGAVMRGERDLVFCAPTSGGKTLVAEILMLRALARSLSPALSCDYSDDYKDGNDNNNNNSNDSDSNRNSNGLGLDLEKDRRRVRKEEETRRREQERRERLEVEEKTKLKEREREISQERKEQESFSSSSSPINAGEQKEGEFAKDNEDEASLRRTMLFVVPFISLAEEKAHYFHSVWRDLRLGVRVYHTEDGLDTQLGRDVDLVVCTIERANLLLNQLLEERRERQLSLVVVDEIHLLADAQRGFLLEILLAKIKFIEREREKDWERELEREKEQQKQENESEKSDKLVCEGNLSVCEQSHHTLRSHNRRRRHPRHSRTQIVGMSATLPNVCELAQWLRAALFVTQFRPVSLSLRAVMNGAVFRCSVREKTTADNPEQFLIQEHNTLDQKEKEQEKETAKERTLQYLPVEEKKIVEAVSSLHTPAHLHRPSVTDALPSNARPILRPTQRQIMAQSTQPVFQAPAYPSGWPSQPPYVHTAPVPQVTLPPHCTFPVALPSPAVPLYVTVHNHFYAPNSAPTPHAALTPHIPPFPLTHSFPQPPPHIPHTHPYTTVAPPHFPPHSASTAHTQNIPHISQHIPQYMPQYPRQHPQQHTTHAQQSFPENKASAMSHVPLRAPQLRPTQSSAVSLTHTTLAQATTPSDHSQPHSRVEVKTEHTHTTNTVTVSNTHTHTQTHTSSHTSSPPHTEREVVYEYERSLRNEAPSLTHASTSTRTQSQTHNLDGFLSLCVESVLTGLSSLVFMPSKRRCESAALSIAQTLHSLRDREREPHNETTTGSHTRINNTTTTGVNGMRPILTHASRHMNTTHSYNTPNKGRESDLFSSSAALRDRLRLLDSLSQSAGGLCEVLRESVVWGVAYHHAGLTVEERKLIENAFRTGVLRILCTTSTLAAGVNLPASRVIIRSMLMGDTLLSVASFKQMCGRAGRTGSDREGEAIVCLDNARDQLDRRLKTHCDHLLCSDVEPLRSSLHLGNGGGLEKLLLEMIVCGRLQREQQVMSFVACTLLHVQMPSQEVLELVTQAVKFLKQGGFVLLSRQGVLLPSALGKATVRSGIAPKDAAEILPSLLQARERLLLHHGNAGLHSVFLVTPPCTLAATPAPASSSSSSSSASPSSSLSAYRGSTGGIEPDWMNLEALVDALSKDYAEVWEVLARLQVDRGMLVSCKFQRPSLQSERYKLLKRLFNAILLFMLIQEWPLSKIMPLTALGGESSSSPSAGNGGRGMLQQLLRDASTFCGMVVVFCRTLQWRGLALAVEELQTRLCYGAASKDVLPLLRLGRELLSVPRARVLWKNELRSAADLVRAGTNRIAQVLVQALPVQEKRALVSVHSHSNDPIALAEQEEAEGEGDEEEIMDSVARPRCAQEQRIFAAYLRLAKNIISRAQQQLQDEMMRKQQQFFI